MLYLERMRIYLMTKETQSQTIVKTVYVAEDGTHFDSELSCEIYEEDLKYDRLEKRFIKCRAAQCPEADKLFRYFEALDEKDLGAGWYIFKTDEDIATAVEYARYTRGYKQIGEIEKNTLYLIMEYNMITRWFKVTDVLSLQKIFTVPVIQ